MEWINIKGHLPRLGIEVLTYDTDGTIAIDTFSTISSEDVEDGFVFADSNSEITHWMPLPDAPLKTNNRIPVHDPASPPMKWCC